MTGILVSVRGAMGPGGDTVQHSFSIESLDNTLPPAVDRVLPDAPGNPVYRALAQMQGNPAVDTNVVVNAGTALMASLNSHENAKDAIKLTLGAPAGDALRHARIDIPPILGEPHNLPWEVLFTAESFVDVQSGVPILRGINPNARAIRPPDKLTGGVLKIVSVLAADGIDGIDEYKALRSALNGYARPFRLRVFSPDLSVQEAVTAESNSSIEFKPVPGTTDALMQDIAGFAPQLCHFLCHGLAPDKGAPSLEIANILTLSGGASLSMMPGQLEAVLPSSAWLVMLNACRSGEVGGPSGALAARLVECGVPVVVGMREPTEARTLHSFTRGFLSSALQEIDAALMGGVDVPLHLCRSMTSGRLAICQAQAGAGAATNTARRIKDWSLPVMFVSADPFVLRPTHKTEPGELAKLLANRKTLADFLEASRASLTPPKVARIEQQIALLDQQIQVSI